MRLFLDQPERLINLALQESNKAVLRQDYPLAQRRAVTTARAVAKSFRNNEALNKFHITEQHRRYITNMLESLNGKTGRELENGAILPFLKLKDQLKQEAASEEDERLLILLDHLESRSRAQCARYDGPLQGTRVGMNLFYTDLLAKLWAGVDYYGEAPVNAVPGFLTMPQSNFLLEA